MFSTTSVDIRNSIECRDESEGPEWQKQKEEKN
jgi:hypothetical protein